MFAGGSGGGDGGGEGDGGGGEGDGGGGEGDGGGGEGGGGDGGGGDSGGVGGGWGGRLAIPAGESRRQICGSHQTIRVLKHEPVHVKRNRQVEVAA